MMIHEKINSNRTSRIEHKEPWVQGSKLTSPGKRLIFDIVNTPQLVE